MENSVNTMNSSVTHSLRHRKSIFGQEKPKADDQDPKLLLNGQTFTQWHSNKPSTADNFHQPAFNRVEQSNLARTQQILGQSVRKSGSFYLPDHPVSRVIITNPNQTSCVRPSSAGRKSVIVNQPQIIQRPITIMTQSRVPSYSPQVLSSSRIIPSQTSNIAPSNIFLSQGPSCLKRKSVMYDGRPHENVVFRHSPMKQRPIETVTQIRPEVSRILIQDDPKTISELNKLSSLNQFLSQQYNLVNNELHYIKTKTSQKQVVNDREFLQKSLNRIDDIFLRQTNQALYKLDQISRCSSSKGFSKSSNSRLKRNPSPSPTFSKITQHQQYIVGPSNMYTPIKGVEQMQNSVYVPCDHVDLLSIYDEEA